MNNIPFQKVKNFLEVLNNEPTSFKVLNLNFLNKKDSQGNTILHNAVINKDLSLTTDIVNLKKLIDDTKLFGGFLNTQNNEGNTSLHLAAKACQDNKNCATSEAIAKLLHVSGSDPNIRNKGGFIVSSSESPPSASEYRDRLFSMFGGQQSPTNSINSGSSVKKSNLDNITTEVSVDNFKAPKVDNFKRKLMDYASEVSIDNGNKSVTESSSSSLSGGSSSLSSSVSSSVSDSSSLTESQSGGSSSSGALSSSGGLSSSSDTNLTESSSISYSGSSSISDNQKGGQRGGSKLTESSELSDTSTFVKSLLTQFNSMKGGSRNVRGSRILPSLSDYELSEMYGGRDFGLSREQMKESSNIHDEVVKMFMDNGKTEEEARIMKMALYKYTKDKNPELNNLDRAKKMKEYAHDSKIIKSLDLTTTRKIYEDVKKSKSMMSDTDNSPISSASSLSQSEMTETTEELPKKKTTAKKTSAKKTSAKKSK